jgi:peroxiredoxin
VWDYDEKLASLPDYNAARGSVFTIDHNGKVQYKWVFDNPPIEPNYQEIEYALKKLKNKDK